ncbi:hypothetical protein [Algoriphagus sp.]|uniref:hypothetical protein n=1 Tax=Algoriphagus sp. TaxID=1872435 RepID=UPI0025F23938|nr:hypothetical protein [Algoriphagus sp.]
MKNRIQNICFAVFISFAINSCSPIVYSNVGHNAPMFEKKGEVSINPSYASSNAALNLYQSDDASRGFGFQGGYALSDKVAIISSFYSMGGEGDPEIQDWKGNGTYVEFGGGIYGRSQNKKIGYEVLGGIGFSGIKNKNFNGLEYLNVSITKPFIQPSIGFISKYFECSFIPRIAYVSIEDRGMRINDSNRLSDLRRQFEKNNKQVVFEPGLQFRFGFENVKMQLQWSFSNFNFSSDEVNFHHDSYGSIGLNFRIKGQNENELSNY